MNNAYDQYAQDEISMRAPLYSPDTLFGMEPFLAKVFIAGAAAMILIFQTQLSIGVAMLIIGLGIPWLRKQGKVDPQWSSVVIRSMLLQEFYPATSYATVKRPKFRQQQRIKRSS